MRLELIDRRAKHREAGLGAGLRHVADGGFLLAVQAWGGPTGRGQGHGSTGTNRACWSNWFLFWWVTGVWIQVLRRLCGLPLSAPGSFRPMTKC